MLGAMLISPPPTARISRRRSLAAEQRYLELLPNDKANEQFKAQLHHTEQKIAKLKGTGDGQ